LRLGAPCQVASENWREDRRTPHRVARKSAVTACGLEHATVSLAAVRFKITRHSGFSAPEDALELLVQRLGPRREEVSFAKVGGEIWATLQSDAPVSMTHDERSDIGRRAVLDVVREVCDGMSGLKSDWFAVSPER
jgi:hypothetical protein